MKRLSMLLVPFLTVGALTAAAHAGNLSTRVQGRGIVTLKATGNDTILDPPAFVTGDQFANNLFAITGKVKADGTANGTATFVFGEGFSTIWGTNVIKLTLYIKTGTVSQDGTVVMQGSSLERDFLNGVFFTERTPFEIVVNPNGLFTLRWCELPALILTVTDGYVGFK